MRMATLGTSLRLLFRDRLGSSAVEFAFVAPPLLLLLLGGVEVGRLVWTQSALHFAVEEAARCATADPTKCGSTTSVQNFAVSVSGVDLSPSVFSVTTPACGNQVSATYGFQFLSQLFPYAVNLTAQSCFPRWP
jgi:Flp pilus assembly protein TadG